MPAKVLHTYLQHNNHNISIMKLIEHFFNLLAPRECVICGKEGKILCSWCLPDAFTPLPSRCYKCLKLTNSSITCEKCRTNSRLNHVWVVTGYENTAKKLVRHLKYGHYRDVAGIMAVCMDNIMPVLPKDVIVVPVPAVNNHIRVRGFDQSRLIAKELSKVRKLLYVDTLARHGKIQQVGSGYARRHSQLEDAIRVRKLKTIKGAKILLVDDVITTGSTLEVCAKHLKEAGALSVSAVCFAQTVKK